MLDPRVRQLAVVNQAVYAAKVDESTEIGEPDDDAFANLRDFERIEKLLLLRLQLFFEHESLRENDAMALMIEIDHFETQMLSDELVEISDGLPADLRGRNESAHAQIDEYAALHYWVTVASITSSRS